MKIQKMVLIFPFILILCLSVELCLWYLFSGTAPVPGWENNVSRNGSHYINEKIRPHLLNENFCKESKFILIIICSKPDHFEARQAIRETWGQKHDNVSFFYLMGEIGQDEVLQNKINKEFRYFGDVIQERFIDTYSNLTLKSLHMLKLYTIYCKDTHPYLIKVDDDVFLNVEKILNKLGYRTITDKLLTGRNRHNSQPFRNRINKWYMPYEWYPYKFYPNFLCGPSYVMSSDVAIKLYNCALTEVPLIHLEDVLLTGICAKRMHIHLSNDLLFNCNRGWIGMCKRLKLYTVHQYSPDDMRKHYQVVTSNDFNCEENSDEFNVLLQWIFFTGLPWTT